MLITLATLSADPQGYVEIMAVGTQTAGEQGRRVSRIATLDGGAVVNDGGFSDADRTVEITWRPLSAEGEAAVARLVRYYAQASVSLPDGVYRGALEALNPGAAESRLRVLLLEKLSA